MKKVLSLFMSAVMLLSVTAGLNLTAYAETLTGSCGENVTYTLDTDTGILTISGTGDMTNFFAGDMPWYSNKESIKEVAIKNGLTSIGSEAFYYCTSLISIAIPNSVTSIGKYAFDNCTSLTDVTIGNSVTSIGDGAFSDCTSLTSITIPNNVTSIGYSAFKGCLSLSDVTIGNGVTSIGDWAFSDCTNLTSIAIPSNVTSIGYDAFYNTAYYHDGTNWENDILYIGNYLIDAKENISGAYVIKSGTKLIANSAFHSTSLTSIIIPDSVINIGDAAFYNTPYYNNKSNWENNVLYIDNCLLEAKTSINGAYEIKENTKVIADSAFDNCISLTSITIPDSVTSIGKDTFSNCTSITNVYYNGSVSEWCNIKFNGDTSYPNYYFGSSFYIQGDLEFTEYVTTIPDRAFQNCKSLTEVVLEDSVTSIGEDAFSNCTNLTSIAIGNSVTNIGEYAFYMCTNLTSVSIGNSVASIGNRVFEKCTSLTSIIIPNSVTSIGEYVVYGCTRLTKIVIGNGMTSIGDHTFYNCTGLKNIIIPDSVTSIGSSAFSDCTNLKSISIPNSVTSIGSYAFYYCTSLKSITIPNSVTSIEDNAFYYTGLSSVSIPNTIQYIGEDAFGGKGKLQDVYFGGTKEQWNEIKNGRAIIRNASDTLTIHYMGECEGGNHNWDDGIVTEKSTCSKHGTILYTCLDCGVTKTEDRPLIDHNYSSVAVIPATCTESGYTVYTCSKCGNTYQDDFIIALGHNFGSNSAACLVCGAANPNFVIPTQPSTPAVPDTPSDNAVTGGNTSNTSDTSGAPMQIPDAAPAVIDASGFTVKLAKTKYAYNGKVKKPAVTVYDKNGKKLSSSDYTLTYTGNANPGKKKVVIKFKDSYSGTITKYYKIIPKKQTISSLRSTGKKKIKVTWKKDKTVSGYQVQYSTSKKFYKSKSKSVFVSKKNTSKTISKLKSGKKYYVRVRAYKTIDGKKVYGSWSSVKSVKVK